MLGPAEYELRLGSLLNSHTIDLPAPVQLTAQGPDWLRFSSGDPQATNPQVLRYLLAQGLEVVSLQEVPRSLEQVYLQAIGAPDGQEHNYAG